MGSLWPLVVAPSCTALWATAAFPSLAQPPAPLAARTTRRSDCIPHLSAASVEALLLEASEESPVRKTVEGWGSKAGLLASALTVEAIGSKLASTLVGLSGLASAPLGLHRG